MNTNATRSAVLARGDEARVVDDATVHSEAQPHLLVDRGRVIGRNLRREFVTRDELDERLRKHGVTEIAQVRAAYMESDGEFSVLTYSRSRGAQERRRTPGA
jgi:uncharacterized membrane protein YcaP (DUF421 family)